MFEVITSQEIFFILHICDVECLFEKAEELSITFDVEKSELVHFSGKKQPLCTPLILSHFTLEPKELVRWLGVWFDRKLSFKAHVEKRL